MSAISAASMGLVALLVVVVALLVAASLAFASLEAAVVRVTRAGLNNLMLETQTSEDLSTFQRAKAIRKLHQVQLLIADRFATVGSCVFFRIICHIGVGVCVALIAQLIGCAWWMQLIIGAFAGAVIALISVLMRPRIAGVERPSKLMLQYVKLAVVARKLTPFAMLGSRESAQSRKARAGELSDDETLEKLQLEQGKATIDRLVETNNFDPEVSEMLRNVLTLSDTLTREIMVPRTDMICVDRHDSLTAFLQLCSRSGFSRVPVIGEDVDELIGVAYLKDAVRATAFNPAAAQREVESISRDPMLVPESKPVDDLFHEMQRTRQHVALVVDEYGGIAGMVTIEDALEQIVGELQDEHDRTQHAEPEQLGEHCWRVPARTAIADVEELFEVTLDEDDVDTVYGLLTKLLGRVPIVGSSALTRGLRFTAVDSAGRRKKVSTIVVELADAAPAEHNATHDGSADKDTASSAASQDDARLGLHSNIMDTDHARHAHNAEGEW